MRDVRSEAKPLLVGELNPYGSDEQFALYPQPKGCAGWRLCHKVMGISSADYMGKFDRVNLCSYEWSDWNAFAAAGEILKEKRPVLILLGRKVARAFGVSKLKAFTIAEWSETRVLLLLHPSGRCRTWNEPDAIHRARAALRKVGAL